MNLEQYFKDFQDTFMPSDFSWRKGQKEAVISIIDTYFNSDYNAVILDAPVGSGKSLIAMCAAWVLNKRGKEGYVLSSDISLQDQYEKDLNKFNFSWGSVKGLDNYECIDNFEKVPIGTCKLQGKEPRKMYCYDECPYYSARDRASNSPTAMLNYAYWLTMMNEVNSKISEEKQIFPIRDFTFCDEAHKLVDIIQNTYSPKFSDKIVDKIRKLSDFFKNYNVAHLGPEIISIERSIKSIKSEEDQEKLLGLISKIALNLENFKDPIKLLKDRVKNEYKEKPPKEWRRALWISDWTESFQSRLIEYIDIITKTSIKNLIKNPNGEEVVFNCLEERYLMHKYFHSHTGFAIFMSATFSDPSAYLKGIALKGAKYIRLESQFDFSKSPIYFYNKRRMSYNHINSNLPWLSSKVNEIIKKHKGESGLIHSASYKLSSDIFNNLNSENRDRVLIYNGTDEKRRFLEELKIGHDKILMGPSLLEGLDMKDDFGRFQIFAKVPYLSLGDRFVKTKMNINPQWYRWKAIVNILQGTGRIVRNENDWGITYILDGSLSDLIHNNRRSFPSEFMKRIQVIDE